MIREKIGILCPNPDILFHYQGILSHLQESDFDVIATSYDDAFLDILDDYPHVYAHPLIQQKITYRITLSHYYLLYYDQVINGVNTGAKMYLPEILGKTNVRLMYALGKDYWNYADWNKIYDAHLCFGPWQAQKLAHFGSQIHEVGYPRYDHFFEPGLDVSKIKAQLNIATDRPVIVWLPTKTQHTINEFKSQIAALTVDYQVILKPHPASWEDESELMSELETENWFLMREHIDNQLLFAITDFVLCDYGGPPFGAIYTDQNLLLLDHALDQQFELSDHPFDLDHPKDIQHLNPSETLLREHIAHVRPQDSIEKQLQDKVLWETQKSVRTELRKTFFSDNYGKSAKEAAQILQGLLAQKKPK